MDRKTADLLVRLIECLEGGGPFSGLWKQTIEHMESMGYSEEEVESAVKKLWDDAGLSRD